MRTEKDGKRDNKRIMNALPTLVDHTFLLRKLILKQFFASASYIIETKHDAQSQKHVASEKTKTKILMMIQQEINATTHHYVKLY